MTQQLAILLVPHTHWDREWYQTFQQFRIRLVQAVDKLLDILDSDTTFHHFMLDGQTIILDDYLEIQPEQEERLREHIRSGRILVGPWYVQPDEFLVSGESLIRNLQVGLRQATDFGNPMYVGYVPDSFGHIAQLPQILQGVGIDNAVFWRGVGVEAKKSEFYWQAPDGSSVFVAHLADPIGYSNARHMPLSPEEFVTRVELLIANILPKANTHTLLFMNGSDHLEVQAGLPATIQAANEILCTLDSSRQNLLQKESTLAYSSIVVQLGTLPQYLERVRQAIPRDALQTLSGEMRSSQYAHLLPSVLSSRIWIKQQNTATEHLLTHWVEPLTAWAWKNGATYQQGLVRKAWQYLLQNHPHDSICGCSIDQVHRENAVRFAQSQQIAEELIQQAMQHLVQKTDTRAPFPTQHISYEPVPIVVFNPAPGPRIEEVRVEVQLPGSLQNAVIVDQQGTMLPYRVVKRWRQEIGSSAFAREMLATAVMLSGIASPVQLVQLTHSTIVSTLGEAYEASVITRVHIQDDSILSHEVHSSSGVVPIEIMIAPQGRVIVNEQELTTAGQHMLDLLAREDIHTFDVSLVDQARETIDFLATGLPAYGYTTFWLYPRGLQESVVQEQSPQQKLTPLARQNSIENEFYTIEANAQDGTLTIIDKVTGDFFTGLNRFVDGGDVGDLYNYNAPEHDTLVSEPTEPPRIEVVNAEALSVTLRITSHLTLPECCSTNRTDRSKHTTDCTIESAISLFPGVRRIHIHTSVDNKVKDHRLRVLFPIPYTVAEVAAEGTFEVRMRPVAQTIAEDVAEWIETPVNVFPQKRFVDVSNGISGLAVLNRGLPEYEVLQSGPGITGKNQMAIAVTLLRCVEWLSRGDLTTRRGHAGPMEHTPEAQCLGLHEFDYALIPHAATWQFDEALVLREAQTFNIPVHTQAIVTEQHNGLLPARATFVEVEPRSLVVSAVKRSNDGRGLVVRIYNPLPSTVSAKIQPGVAFVEAYMTNLLEERQELVASTPQNVQVVEFAIRSGEIKTLMFE